MVELVRREQKWDGVLLLVFFILFFIFWFFSFSFLLHICIVCIGWWWLFVVASIASRCFKYIGVVGMQKGKEKGL